MQVVYKANDGINDKWATGVLPNTTTTALDAEDIGFGGEGYTFLGWSTEENPSEDDSGAFIKAGDDIAIGDTSVVLYAQWKLPTYDVTYDLNYEGASGAPEAQEKEKGKGVRLHAAVPARDPDVESVTTTLALNDGTDAASAVTSKRTEGWAFVEWTTNADGTGDKYKPGDTYDKDEDATLYAQWQVEDPSYGSVALPAPADRDGYDFKGWDTAQDGAGTRYAAGDTYTPNADTTLYAQWALKTYDITYDANGSGVTDMPDSLTVPKTHGEDLVVASAPTRADSEQKITLTLNYKGGEYDADSDVFNASKTSDENVITTSYAFAGWDTNQDAKEGAYNATDDAKKYYKANEGATLYAIWAPTVSGSAKTYTLPRAKWTGDVNHDFQGWTTADYISAKWADIPADSKWEVGANVTPTESATLYAVWNPPTYAIEYDGNGGGDTVTGVPASQSKEYDENETKFVALDDGTGLTRTLAKSSYKVSYDKNDSASAPAVLAADTSNTDATDGRSYTFKEWSTQPGGGETTYVGGYHYTANADVRLYAQWTATGNVPSVTLPTPTRSGFDFDGWYTATEGGEKAGDGGATYEPADDVTLHAHWTAKKYEIKYNGNPADSTVKDVPANQEKTGGEDLTLAAGVPVRDLSTGAVAITYNAHEGALGTTPANPAYATTYTFLRWNTVADDSGDKYAPGSAYAKNEAATLYAQWSESDAFGAVTLPSVTAPEGCDFVGWFDGEGADAKEVGTAGESYEPASKDAVALHAKFEKTKYPVTYDGNAPDEVSNMPADQQKVHGEALTLDSKEPTRANTTTSGITVHFDGRGGTNVPTDISTSATTKHEFEKWTVNDDGTGNSYSAGDSYTGNAALKLYAKWKDTTTGDDVVLPAGPNPPVGYTFVGWSTDKNALYTETDKWQAKGTKVNPTEDVTYYAIYNPPTYIVHYDANGGSNPPSDQNKKHDVSLLLDGAEPSWANEVESYDITYNANGGSAAKATDRVTATTSYTFKGWAEDSLVGSTAGIVTDAQWGGYDSAKKHAGGDSYANNADLDLYAQYTASTETAPTKVKLPTADRPGYTFLGWYTDAEGGTFVGDAGAEITAPEAATPYYAHWKEFEEPQDTVAYTVVFKVPEGEGGSVEKDSQAFTFGESKALDAGAVTPPSGKVFSHWASEGGTTYTQKQLVSNLTNVDGAEVVLTAVWKEVTNPVAYKVQYYEQGVDGNYQLAGYELESDDAMTGESGETVTVPASALSAPLGFHLNEADTVKSGTVSSTEELVLKVYWARNAFKVEFKKGADDATGTMDDQDFAWASGEKLDANKFARPGWKFTGWKVTEQNGMTAQGEGFMSVQSDDAAAMVAQALGDLVADRADGSKLSWVDGDRVVLTAQWEKDTSGGNGDDDDHGGNKPGGGGDDDDNPGGDKPGGGDDDDDNRGGDKPGGGDGPGGGGSGSDADNGGGSGAERAGFTREAAGSGANGKAPGTGDPMMAVLQCLGAMALLAALALALSLRQSRRSARVVGTWSAPARQAAAKRPTPRKVDRGRHARR